MRPSRVFWAPLAAACLVLGAVAAPAPAATDDEIQAAIEAGVAYLAAAQNADGSWSTWEQTAVTALVLIKLQDRAWELGIDPFDPGYAYAEQVEAGWGWLFGHATTASLSLQDHTAGASGSLDDPDGDGDGIGVHFDSPGSFGHHTVYTTGLVLMALKASGDPSRSAAAYGYPSAATFGEVAQDAVDWLAFAQGDLYADEGGWGYSALNNGWSWTDNSNSGYAVLGLAAGESFDCTVPAWVRTEMAPWLLRIQDPVDGDAWDGGSNYTPSWTGWVNVLKTGNLLFEFTFVGDDPSTPRFMDALDYIERAWSDWPDPGWGRYQDPSEYQAMFALMKGFEYSGVDAIDLDGDSVAEHDWYAEFADVLVAQQNADGSWFGSLWSWDPVLDTAWALLTLERVSPPPPVVEVVVDVKPMSWPNPLNVRAKGTLPVAVLGTEEFDVTTIDPATVLLCGVAPIRWEVEDVGTPGDPWAGPDGILDLSLKFEQAEVAAACGPVDDGDVVEVALTGALTDGRGIVGSDLVVIIEKK